MNNLQWLDEVKFNEQGLVPAIAQHHQTGRVLMVAWMNREALALTAEKNQAARNIIGGTTNRNGISYRKHLMSSEVKYFRLSFDHKQGLMGVLLILRLGIRRFGA